MAPSSSVGCLGGVAAVTVAAGGILEQVAKAILYIINRREIACLECGKLKQPEKMRRHFDKHRARDADKSEAEKAALKAEYDRKLAEQQLKMEDLTSFLDYQARCQRDWFEQAKAKERDQKKALALEEHISNAETGKRRCKGSRGHPY
ncbi:uncharacterized protein LOC119298954 [Triticum dicoccoides]|uniref:uncharacterized protein LOC119298954 n=1 Tax=Triticum dicoccoides TaxID=85692 RepID=UPI0018903D0A|nr:uncharacterized protein LOC119298954 [Triticum dicoccoides]